MTDILSQTHFSVQVDSRLKTERFVDSLLFFIKDLMGLFYCQTGVPVLWSHLVSVCSLKLSPLISDLLQSCLDSLQQRQEMLLIWSAFNLPAQCRPLVIDYWSYSWEKKSIQRVFTVLYEHVFWLYHKTGSESDWTDFLSVFTCTGVSLCCSSGSLLFSTTKVPCLFCGSAWNSTECRYISSMIYSLIDQVETVTIVIRRVIWVKPVWWSCCW